jgi:hypothetical protein
VYRRLRSWAGSGLYSCLCVTGLSVTGLAWLGACGARAEGTAVDDGEADDSPAGRPGQTGSAARGGAGGSRGAARPSGAAGATAALPAAGEVCYSDSDLNRFPLVRALLPTLPAGAWAANGCLTGNSAALLSGGMCTYDGAPPVLRGERCCYVVKGASPGCANLGS